MVVNSLTDIVFPKDARMRSIYIGALLVAFAMGAAVAILLVFDTKELTVEQVSNDLELHMQMIDPTDSYQYLYVDANLGIEFFYNILDFKESSPTTYTECLQLANDYLHVVDDVRTDVLVRPVNNIRNAEEIGKELLNKYHAFIFSVDVMDPVISSKFADGMERLKMLINRLNDEMRSHVTKRYAYGGSSEGVLPQLDAQEGIELGVDGLGLELYDFF